MPQSTPAPPVDLRTAIDIDTEYTVQVRDGTKWTRPAGAEHRTLPGLDVWHTARRARRAYAAEVLADAHGILTLASTTASMRFIPSPAYEDLFCRAEDCEESIDDGEGRNGLCRACADRARTPLNHPARQAPTTNRPYTEADLRTAAATVYRMLLDSLDALSGVGEGIGDRAIPSTAGTTADRTWQSLGNDEASRIYRTMWRLLNEAPDLSRWAVDMAADHLTPEPVALTHQQGDTPSVRLHIAFAAHVTPDERAALHEALRAVLRNAS